MTPRPRLDAAPDGLANPEWVRAVAAEPLAPTEAAPAPRDGPLSAQDLRRRMIEGAVAGKLLDAHLRNRIQLMQSRPTDLSGLPQAEATLLIRAMIAAAHADGLVDPDERRRLVALARAGISDEAVRQQLLAEVDAPPALEHLLRLIETTTLAERFYAVSATVARRERPTNRAYLAYLAIRLEIDEDVVLRLNRETDATAPRISRLPG